MYYRKLKLPCPPQHLIDKCIEIVKDGILNPYKIYPQEQIDFTNRLDTYWRDLLDSYKWKHARYSTSPIPDDMKEWFYNNLPIKENSGMWLQIFKDGYFVPPHVDNGYKNTINCLITDSDAVTCWYKPKKEFEHLDRHMPGENAQFLYERLDRVKEVKFEKNVWYMLNNDEIHSVENVENKLRISLKIGVKRF